MTRLRAALAAVVLTCAVLATAPTPSVQDQAIRDTALTDGSAWRGVNRACSALRDFHVTPTRAAVWLEQQHGVHPDDAATLVRLAVADGCGS